MSVQTTVDHPLDPTSTAPDAQSQKAPRLVFVDNIRVFLTILVLLFHLMIIYAGTGSWVYTEGREDMVTGALGTWFLGVNQAYFMGLFLLISAYFVPGSYARKGAWRFFKDRLIRLGIPLALYSWIIRPILVYFDPVRFPGTRLPFWRFITDQYFKDEAVFGAGPLWFIEVLLIFSAVYIMGRRFVHPRQSQSTVPTSFPSRGVVVGFALLLAIATFLVRLVFPMGYNFGPLNLQFSFFAQYIALFVIGLMAYSRNWLQQLPDRMGRRWLWTAGVVILLFWPLMLGGGAIDNGIDAYAGGWHWQAFALALWESFLCVGMCIGLIYLFRRYANRQGQWAGFFSRNAYTAYLIHEVVITSCAYLVRGVDIYPLLKWALVSLVAVPLCFGLSELVRKLPYANRVLG